MLFSFVVVYVSIDAVNQIPSIDPTKIAVNQFDPNKAYASDITLVFLVIFLF